MATKMSQKQYLFKKHSRWIATGLMVVVLGTAAILSTDFGKSILGIELNPFSSRANGGKFHKSAKPVKDQYIVVLKDSADSDAETTKLKGKYGGQIIKTYRAAIKGFATTMTEQQAIAMSNDPDVEYIDENSIIEPQSIQTNATWGISRIDNHNPFVNPLDSNYEYNTTGKGVNVYVFDTGIYADNPDFGGRVTRVYDYYNDGQDMTKCNGHGTHVAGTIGSTTYGVAKEAKLYDIKIHPCSGSGTNISIMAGIDYVMQHLQLPAVANMSLGAPYSSGMDSLEKAIQNMINKGVTTAVAAGNDDLDACNFTPARIPDAITVGASGSTDSLSNTTDFGKCVDVFAPGVNIISTYPKIDPNTGLMSGPLSGTSTASPHAAGVAALYLETHPTALPKEVSNAIVSNATPGLLYNVPNDTPNLLLYSLINSGGTTPPPPTGDTTPPTITTKPSSNTSLKKGQLKFSATASDSSGIATIVITLDGADIKTCYGITTCSASIAANSLTVGNHALTTTATDKAAVPNTGSKTIIITK